MDETDAEAAPLKERDITRAKGTTPGKRTHTVKSAIATQKEGLVSNSGPQTSRMWLRNF
jgi:hypothetical protein